MWMTPSHFNRKSQFMCLLIRIQGEPRALAQDPSTVSQPISLVGSGPTFNVTDLISFQRTISNHNTNISIYIVKPAPYVLQKHHSPRLCTSYQHAFTRQELSQREVQNKERTSAGHYGLRRKICHSFMHWSLPSMLQGCLQQSPVGIICGNSRKDEW